LIKNNKIFFEENDDAPQKFYVEKKNFIIKKILSDNTLYKIISKYINENYPKWETIQDHLEKIKKFLIEYVEKKVIETISK
jgi:hypothetical protein